MDGLSEGELTVASYIFQATTHIEEEEVADEVEVENVEGDA
jgi:hypothetical protein